MRYSQVMVVRAASPFEEKNIYLKVVQMVEMVVKVVAFFLLQIKIFTPFKTLDIIEFIRPRMDSRAHQTLKLEKMVRTSLSEYLLVQLLKIVRPRRLLQTLQKIIKKKLYVLAVLAVKAI